mmetsp:Transcript_23200/g.68162  ORF Transcript_23200/g.68162 Transcript_23200/m.68162 type:complete len:344 (-) Transcript_23200:293-1324(-)
MGSRSYTKQVVDAIDPERKIFTSKILCREDGEMETFQKSLDHLDGSDDERHRMIVLDDREDAWDATSRGHVLQIPAFRYFRDGGGMQPLSKEGGAADTSLLDVLHVVRTVHRSLVAGEHQSVPEVLHAARRSVLANVNVVFSGGLLSDAQQPERSAHWRLAEAFGARCHLYWNDSVPVTHVVSPKPSTKTVERAVAAEGVHAVHVGWLTDSCARWLKQLETPYLLRPKSPFAPGTSVPASGNGLPPLAEDGFPGGLERTVDRALELVPALDVTLRLKALIKYLVPWRDKEKANELFGWFDAALADNNQAAKDEALCEITSLVGQQTLVLVLSKLGVNVSVPPQ